MRAAMTVALLLLSSWFSGSGTAQVFGTETPPPIVTAAGAPWQLSRDPIFYAHHSNLDKIWSDKLDLSNLA